jgi:anti-sigma regulatory factor (Ser/Thr protein kinase)
MPPGEFEGTSAQSRFPSAAPCAGRPRDARPRAGADRGLGRTETRVPVDLRAAGAARRLVARTLHGRVHDDVLGSARLVASELATNSVRHSGATAGESMVIRLDLSSTRVRLEVEDPGVAEAISIRAADQEGGGGFGLNLVQVLSDVWGHDRGPGGGTRVWAELACSPAASNPRGA